MAKAPWEDKQEILDARKLNRNIPFSREPEVFKLIDKLSKDKKVPFAHLVLWLIKEGIEKAKSEQKIAG